MNTISQRVREKRNALGLSQAHLAKRAGISQSAIANIESGLRKRPRDLVSIAGVLGVTPAWLETGNTEERSPPSARTLATGLALLSAQLHPRARTKLATLLTQLVEHPLHADPVEQIIRDIEQVSAPTI